MNLKYQLPLVLSLLVGLNAKSQYSEEYTTYKDKYPESQMVRLNDEVLISVEINNNDLDIKQSFIEEDLFLSESATYGSKRSLNFSSFFELESVKATSFSFDNGKYKAYKVDDFVEKDELDNSFHDDTKSVNFIYPNLSKGSKTKLEYTETVKNPRFLNPIYFADFYPIQRKKATLIADKDIEFNFVEFNTENFDIQFSKTEKRGQIIYTWELQNIDEFKHESNIPSYSKVFPHIIPIITGYKDSNDKQVTLLNDVSGLYNWYYSLVKDINSEPTDEELVALVNSLTKDATNDFEKVKSIYYWTQQNIKYIDFEYALGGFIPREANDIFNKKYGDCKDNSSILHEMLKLAGIKGHLTWIGTRKISYSYNEVPTPMVDNHMILTYLENDKAYYLDATGRYLTLDMPSSFIQGKEALISIDSTNFKILKVPVMEPEKNTFKDVTELKIDANGKLSGHSTTELSGYYKIDFFHQLEDENTEEKIKEYYNRKLRKGNNKFLIETITEQNKFDYDKNLVIDYNFEIDNHAKIMGNELFINLNLNKDLVYFKPEEDRENDIEFKYKSFYDYHTKFQIPDGFSVDYLPKNYIVSNEFFDCNISYSIENNNITYTQNLKLKFLSLNAEKQKELIAAIKLVEKNYKEIVVLKKTS